MSDLDKKFDDLVKAKLNQKQFESGEADWQEMEQLIVAKNNNWKKGLIWFFFSTILIGFFAYLIWGNTAIESQIVGKTTANENQSSTNFQASQNQEKEGKISAEPIDAKNKSESSGSVKEVQSEPIQFTKKVLFEPILSSRNEIEEKSNLTSQWRVGENKIAKMELPIPENSSVLKGADVNNKEKTNIETKLEEKESKIGLVDTSKVSGILSESLALVQTEIKNDRSQIVTSNIDSANNLANNETSNLVRLQSNFTLCFGLNRFKGFENTQKDPVEFSYSPSLGFQYSVHLKSKVSIEIGLHYFYRQKLNSYKTFSAYNYDFGNTLLSNQLEAKTLHYLQLPIELKYSLRLKHAILLGSYSSYLLQSNSKISEVEIGQNETISTNNKLENGYNKGFERLDYGLSLGYEFNTLNRFSFLLKYFYGLKDITRNAYYENSEFDRNKGLQLQVQYHIYQKRK